MPFLLKILNQDNWEYDQKNMPSCPSLYFQTLLRETESEPKIKQMAPKQNSVSKVEKEPPKAKNSNPDEFISLPPPPPPFRFSPKIIPHC